METAELHQSRASTGASPGAGQRRPNEFFVFGAYNGGNNGEPPAPPKGGWGQGEPDMESWQASVDRRLGKAETDLSDLMWKGIYAAVGLAAMVAGLYFYIGAQIGGVDNRINSLSGRTSTLEASVARLDERTASMQKQMDGMDAKLDKLLAK